MSTLQAVFDQGNLPLLRQALSAYALRHRVISENVANVATADYRAQSVDFEELLQAEDRSLVPGLRTHPAHLPVGGAPTAQGPQVVEQSAGFDNGINDVEIDREMVGLAENELMYRMTTRLLHQRYQGLRTAITGRPS